MTVDLDKDFSVTHFIKTMEEKNQLFHTKTYLKETCSYLKLLVVETRYPL